MCAAHKKYLGGRAPAETKQKPSAFRGGLKNYFFFFTTGFSAVSASFGLMQRMTMMPTSASVPMVRNTSDHTLFKNQLFSRGTTLTGVDSALISVESEAYLKLSFS